jgi:hypothetical protein
VGVQLDRADDTEVSGCMGYSSYEKIQLAHVEFAHVRACFGDTDQVRKATIHVAIDIFARQQGLRGGSDETDEIAAHRKYGSWTEIEMYRNLLVIHQELDAQRARNSLARMFTVDSVLKDIFLSKY